MGSRVQPFGNVLRNSRSDARVVSGSAFPVLRPKLQRFLGSTDSHPDFLSNTTIHNGAGPGKSRPDAGVLLPIPNCRSPLLVLPGSAVSGRIPQEDRLGRWCSTTSVRRIGARSSSGASSDEAGSVAWFPTQRGSSHPTDRSERYHAASVRISLP